MRFFYLLILLLQRDELNRDDSQYIKYQEVKDSLTWELQTRENFFLSAQENTRLLNEVAAPVEEVTDMKQSGELSVEELQDEAETIYRTFGINDD